MCKRTMYKRARIPMFFMGTTRMRKQWCPGRFSSGNEARQHVASVPGLPRSHMRIYLSACSTRIVAQERGRPGLN